MNNEVYISDDITRIITALDDPVSVFDAPYELMGRENGKDVTEIGHLIRSLIDILTTPRGSMPTLREYGSRLFLFVDRPMNAELRIDILAGIYEAIDRWEPRIRLDVVELDAPPEDGALIVTMKGFYLLEGRGVELRNVKLDFKKETTLNFEDRFDILAKL